MRYYRLTTEKPQPPPLFVRVLCAPFLGFFVTGSWLRAPSFVPPDRPRPFRPPLEAECAAGDDQVTAKQEAHLEDVCMHAIYNPPGTPQVTKRSECTIYTSSRRNTNHLPPPLPLLHLPNITPRSPASILLPHPSRPKSPLPPFPRSPERCLGGRNASSANSLRSRQHSKRTIKPTPGDDTVGRGGLQLVELGAHAGVVVGGAADGGDGVFDAGGLFSGFYRQLLISG